MSGHLETQLFLDLHIQNVLDHILGHMMELCIGVVVLLEMER